jgi:hypothetical protein
MKDSDNGKNQLVKITTSVAGIMLVTVIIFVIFAKESIGILVPVIWAFVVLAIVIAAFQYKIQKPVKGK